VARKDPYREPSGAKPFSRFPSKSVREINDTADASKHRRRRPGAGRPFVGLYLVATPIGNARDVTLRALDILAAVDVIACEDTRVTGKLMTIYGIDTPLLSYREHTAERLRPQLIKRLNNGETVALVSDAGTPLVSDPGYKLVRACIEAHLPVTPVPGPSSVLAAAVISGLPMDRFLFAGFLPPRAAARRRALADLAPVPATQVFLESPRRLASSLADMADVLGDRSAAVARELTKVFEEVRRGTLVQLARHYRAEGPPKGEVTVVVAPGAPVPDISATEVERLLGIALARLSVRDAVAQVAAATGLPRSQVYDRALSLKRGTP
jgi:16S rRNA (cytidine1402-2'-O)-methyltransferase